MKRRDFITSAAVATGLAGCGVFTASYTFRYRLRLTVNVEGVLRTGSTVLKTRWVDAGPLSQMGRWMPSYWGDAVTVLCQGSSALIGMLGALSGYNGGFSFRDIEFMSLLGAVDHRPYDDDECFRQLEDLKGIHPLHSDLWPLMTFIADIHDLRSAKVISRDEPDERFSIQEFTLEMTKDSVSHGIQSQVPCLNQVGTFHPSWREDPRSHPPYEMFNKRNFNVNGDHI